MERYCAVCGAAVERAARVGPLPRYCGWRCRSKAHSKGIRPLSEAERFWQHVDRSAGPDGCWQWIGGATAKGYGAFGIGGSQAKGGFQTTAQRVALALKEGRPLADLRTERRYALHTCDFPPCCNPAHLFWGTQRENLEDMRAKGRRKRTGPPGGQLDAAAAQEIRAVYAAGGVSQTALAGRFGVNQTTISRVIRREIWQHIP